jgi:hypothetical protein
MLTFGESFPDAQSGPSFQPHNTSFVAAPYKNSQMQNSETSFMKQIYDFRNSTFKQPPEVSSLQQVPSQF